MKAHGPVALYIHIPFCQKKCFFCSFAMCIAKHEHIEDYLEALSMEAKRYGPRTVETVYIGGGTPTLLDEAQLKKLDVLIKRNFKVNPRHEYTIETNPDTMDLSKAKLLRQLGFNRVSIGAQSFHDPFLKFLGRTHTAADIKTCFTLLRKAGFLNINLDLMFGFPEQSLRQLKKDLGIAMSLKSEHLSVYNLSIEEKSMFHRLKVALPADEHMALFYRTLIKDLGAKGFHQYEISNFAKPHKESAHNILYWQCRNYIGLGMGAHSHIDGKRFWNKATLLAYIKSVRVKGHAREGDETLSSRQRLTEALLFGLRMNKGICLDELEARFGSRVSMRQKKEIVRFVDHGFLTQDKVFSATTLKGRLVLDELCGYLI